MTAKAKTLHEKLVQIQSELKAPKNQYNSFGKYKYRSAEDIMEAVKPHLVEHSLTMVIDENMIEVGGRVYVKATIQLRAGIDESVVVSANAREAATRKGMDDSQITGATSSYARKYALGGLFCLDDTKDADASNQGNTVAKKRTNVAKKETPDWQPLLDMLGAMSLDQLIAWKEDESEAKGTYKSAMKAYGKKELDECYGSFKTVQEDI